MSKNCALLLLLLTALVGCSGRGADYDPQAEIDRQGQERSRAAREAKFSADDSYQLQLTMIRDGKEDMATADIQEIVIRVLQSQMGEVGLNPDRGANSGEGNKGVIKIQLTAQQSEFGDGGSRVFIPTRFEAKMTVRSNGGSCGWDGEHQLSAEKAAPGRVSGTSDREAQIEALVKEMTSSLPSF